MRVVLFEGYSLGEHESTLNGGWDLRGAPKGYLRGPKRGQNDPKLRKVRIFVSFIRLIAEILINGRESIKSGWTDCRPCWD